MAIRRWQFRKAPYRLVRRLLYFSLVGLTLLGLFFGLQTVVRREAVPVAGLEALKSQTGLLPHWREALFAGIPGLAVTVENNKHSVEITERFSWQQALRRSILFLTRIDVSDIRSLLRAELPLLSILKDSGDSRSSIPRSSIVHFKPQRPNSVGKPLVAIYHTHTSESFISTSGVTHAKAGEQGDIVIVGETLAERLATYDIQAIQSKKVHDYPSFMRAYTPSENTLKKMLADYPSIQMVFDIHRDAEKRENSVAQIDGLYVARISIIVARGQEDLVQPHWQENHAFAKVINDKMNQHFPGLSRGIQVQEWRYNQHLHPRALLLEVGSHETSLEEAQRSMAMLGDVLADVLAENKNYGVR